MRDGIHGGECGRPWASGCPMDTQDYARYWCTVPGCTKTVTYVPKQRPLTALDWALLSTLGALVIATFVLVFFP